MLLRFIIILCVLGFCSANPSSAKAQNHIRITGENKTPAQQDTSAQKQQQKTSDPTIAQTARPLYFMSDSGLTSGSYFLQHEKYAGALQVFNEVLERDPRNTDALAGKGAALIGLQQYDQAQKSLNEAVQRAPKHIGANYLLGRLYAAQNQIDPALDQLRVIHTLCGDDGCAENAALEAEINERAAATAEE